MKYLVLVLLLLGSFSRVTAQDTTAVMDYIYLRDGSVLKGKIQKKEKWSKEITILTSSGSLLTLQRKEISSIDHVRDTDIRFKNGTSIPTKGTYRVFSVAVNMARESDGGSDLEIGINPIHFSIGYRFRSQFCLGGGIGFDYYSFDYIPVYAEIRGDILKKRISPHYAMKAGYGLPTDFFGNTDDQLKGGLMLNPTLGLRFALPQRMNVLLEAGYLFQYTSRTRRSTDRVDEILFQRLQFRMGLIF